MPIVMLGLSHRTAPPDVRDRHSFPPERVVEALGALRDYPEIREAAIVATCNRLEIYAEVDDLERGVLQIKEFLTTYRSMRVDDFDKYLYTMLGPEAVTQLLRVACGLDSMLVGEAEILAQVKTALSAAQNAGTAGSNLQRLFRKALETGKLARTHTGIGGDAVSLGSAAVELAGKHADLTRAHALVVGAGKMASIVARHLRARGVAELVIANRTISTARHLAREVNGRAAGLDDVPALLDASDLVVSAVGSGMPQITRFDVALRGVAHPGRRLLIIDVATPRDVEPQAAEVDGVELYELTDLRNVVEMHLENRRKHITAVEAIVAEHAGAYMRWYRSRAAVPLIADLRQRAESVRAAEIQKLFERLPELHERERALIESTSLAIVNRLLHAPVTKLRESLADRTEQTTDAATLQALLDVDALHRSLERGLRETLAPPAKSTDA